VCPRSFVLRRGRSKPIPCQRDGLRPARVVAVTSPRSGNGPQRGNAQRHGPASVAAVYDGVAFERPLHTTTTTVHRPQLRPS